MSEPVAIRFKATKVATADCSDHERTARLHILMYILIVVYLKHSVLLYFNIVLGLCVLLCVCALMFCNVHSI